MLLVYAAAVTPVDQSLSLTSVLRATSLQVLSPFHFLRSALWCHFFYNGYIAEACICNYDH